MQKNSVRADSNLHMLLSFLKGAWGYFITGILFVCFSAVFTMARPKVIQYTVDGILKDQPGAVPELFFTVFGSADYLKTHLYIPALLVIICTFFSVLFRYGYTINCTKGSETFVKSMRDALYEHISYLTCKSQMKYQTGDLIQRCTSDVDEVKLFLSDHFINFLSMLVTISFSLAFMFRIEWHLALTALMMIPLFVVFSYRFHRIISRLFQECDENEAVLSAIAQENLTGVRVVRAFGKEAFEKERFARENTLVTAAWVKLGKTMCFYFGTADFTLGALMCTILTFGSIACVKGNLTVGGLLAMISYMGMLSTPIKRLGRILSEMSKTTVSLTRIRAILCEETEHTEKSLNFFSAIDNEITANLSQADMSDQKNSGNSKDDLDKQNSANCRNANDQQNRAASKDIFEKQNLTNNQTLFIKNKQDTADNVKERKILKGSAFTGDIEFSHINFAYPGGQQVLHDISFTIPSGSTIGILGNTGSGKSTLAKLLCGLFPSYEGQILVNGEELRTMDVSYIRKNVGFVMQEPYLFSRSIADNIAITDPSLPMEEICQASRTSCLLDVVESFPKGFDTFVGERGVTLSGGQKQRTAIARTLVQHAPVLIFDDSLSAVDAETDARIRENLKMYMGSATVILISHRITTLKEADQILVLSDGHVADMGTHEELIHREGLYRQIAQIQDQL